MNVGAKAQREFMVRTDLIEALWRDAQSRGVRPSHALEVHLAELLAGDVRVPLMVVDMPRARLRSWLTEGTLARLYKRAEVELVGPRVVVEAALLRIPPAAVGSGRSWDLGHQRQAMRR